MEAETLPLFFDMRSSIALVFGSSDAAIRKLEVLQRSQCEVRLVCAKSDHTDTLDKITKDSVDLIVVDDLLTSGVDVWQGVRIAVAATPAIDDRKLGLNGVVF